MTRRQASTIIGLLLMVCLSFAIMIFPGESRSQNEPPLTALDSNGNTIIITDPLTITGQGQFLPPGGDGPGAAIGISVPGGNLTDALEIANSPEMNAALDQQALEKYGPGQSVPVGGPGSRGGIVTIAGRNIQMPDNVEIDGIAIAGSCAVGYKCLEMPAYALLNVETGHTIGVSINSGMVGDPGLPDDELAAIRAEFQWLVDAIPTPTPVPAATSPVATPETEAQQ